MSARDISRNGGAAGGATNRVQIAIQPETPVVLFDVVARGYDRRQVDQHLADVEQELTELRFRQDELAAQRQLLREGQEELERREEQFRVERAAWRPSFAALGERLDAILGLAEQEAGELRARVSAECGERRAAVAEEVAAVRRALAEEREAARRAAAAELAAAREEAARQRSVLGHEIDSRRRDAELEITGRLNRAKVQAEEHLAAARRDGEAMRTKGEQDLAELRRQHRELVEAIVRLRDRAVAIAAEVTDDGRARAVREIGGPPQTVAG